MDKDYSFGYIYIDLDNTYPWVPTFASAVGQESWYSPREAK